MKQKSDGIKSERCQRSRREKKKVERVLVIFWKKREIKEIKPGRLTSQV